MSIGLNSKPTNNNPPIRLTNRRDDEKLLTQRSLRREIAPRASNSAPQHQALSSRALSSGEEECKSLSNDPAQ